MPVISRQIPKTNLGRQQALSKAKSKLDSTPPAGKAVTAPTEARLTTLKGPYDTAMTAVNAPLSDQIIATQDATAALALLQMLIRHFIQVFSFGVERGKYNAAERTYFGIAASDAKVPNIRKSANALSVGLLIKNGDPDRVTAGGAAMANPTAAEVGAAYDAYAPLADTQSNAKETNDMAQEALEALNPGVDSLILKMWNEVETYFSEEDISSKRANARTYGVVYVTRQKLSFTVNFTDSVTHSALTAVTVHVDGGNSNFATDAAGNAAVTTHVAGTLTLLANKAGYNPFSHLLTDEEQATAEAGGTLNFQLASASATGAIVTVIDNATLNPLPGVTGSLQLNGSADPPVVHTSDGSGNIPFSGLAPGTYTLTCSLAGYVTQSITVTVISGSFTSWEVDMVAV